MYNNKCFNKCIIINVLIIFLFLTKIFDQIDQRIIQVVIYL